MLLILLKMSRNIHQSNITLSNYPELHWILLPQNWRRVSLFLRAWGYVSLGNHHIVFSSQSPDGLGRNLQYKSTRRTKQSDNKANIDIFSKNAWNFNTLNVKNFEYTQKNHTYLKKIKDKIKISLYKAKKGKLNIYEYKNESSLIY